MPVVASSLPAAPRRQIAALNRPPLLKRRRTSPSLPPRGARPDRAPRVCPNAVRVKRRSPLILVPPLLPEEPFILRDLQPPREFARARLKELTGNLERNLVNEIGITEQSSVRKNTIIMYDNVMQQFKRIMKTDPIKCSPAHLDQTLVRYFDKLYLEGAAPHAGERLWAALRFLVPHYSAQGNVPLPRAARSLKGWRRLVPQVTRRPLPWIAIAFIARHLAVQGGVGMAICWLTMVDAYLRPGECLGMTPKQVLPATRAAHMKSVVLLLHPDQRGVSSKVGEMNESLVIRRRWLSRLLDRWARSRRGKNLWNFTLPQLRAHFMQAASLLQIDKFRPVLYMGRHSGASLDRLEDNLTLAEVQRRGRWAATSSVRRYEKRALTQEVYLAIPEPLRRQAHRHALELVPLLDRLADAQIRDRAVAMRAAPF